MLMNARVEKLHAIKMQNALMIHPVIDASATNLIFMAMERIAIITVSKSYPDSTLIMWLIN